MRACRFSSVRSRLAPGERLRERRVVGLDHRLDRDLAEVDAERLGELLRVAARRLGRVARRHRDAVHALGAERLDAQRRGQRRVDPAGEPDHDVAEAVLRHVVVQPELEREPHLLQVVELLRRAAGARPPPARAAARARSRVALHARRARGRARAAARRAAAGRPRRRDRRRRRAAPPRSRRHGASTSPSSSSTTEWPSKISSSWPPTALQSATKHELSRRAHASASPRARGPCRRGTATPRCSRSAARPRARDRSRAARAARCPRRSSGRRARRRSAAGSWS